MRTSLLLLLCVHAFTKLHAQLPTSVRIHCYDTIIDLPYVQSVEPAINGSYKIPPAAQQFYAPVPDYTLIYPHRQISRDSVLRITTFQDSLATTFQPGSIYANFKALSDSIGRREYKRLEAALQQQLKEEQQQNENGIIDGIYMRETHFSVPAEDILPKHYVKYDTGVNVYSVNRKHLIDHKNAFQPKVDQLLQPFYMCNHEVTNNEYREFVNWVRDSLALSVLYEALDDDEAISLLNCDKKQRKTLDLNEKKENLQRFGWNYALCTGKNTIYENDEYVRLLEESGEFYYPRVERFYYRREINRAKLVYASMTTSPTPVYPDSLCWLRDHPVSFMDPFTNMYFWHPAYGNHPVVGLSLDQMNAYCDWLQRRTPKGLTVALPTTYQYEMAVKACLPAELRNFVSVDTNDLEAFQRSAEKMVFFILRTEIQMQNFKNPPANSFIYDWFATFQTDPIRDLAGSVSEVIRDQPKDTLSNDQVVAIGGNWSKYVVSKSEEPYNTTFYRQTVSARGNSSTGFRIVLIPSVTTTTNK